MSIHDITSALSRYHPDPDLDLVKKAFVYADRVHRGQRRKSGEPYLMHPLGVAEIVCQLKLDEASLCAALLHDVVEDTPATKEEISELFSEEIAELVDGVTKLSRVAFRSREDRQAESFRKMLIAMSQDIRVILVKTADRLHNMRTLEHMEPEAQLRIAQETLDIYAPLTGRLGIHGIKEELEDLSFKYLQPEEYRDLARRLAKTRRDRERYIARVVRELQGKLLGAGLEVEVTGRPKHLCSIHRKMVAQDLQFEEIYDLIAFRIYVEEVTQCYEALGVVHAAWRPVLRRFKDYIAVPKPNNYQSLHTTVVGPAGELIEIQIRTREMHLMADYGIAAHWRYKEDGKAIQPKDVEKFSWLRQLMEMHQDLADPTDFIETVKVDLFGDEIFVYTPRGDVKVLPPGATPVDFAYQIHTEVGHRCTGAKVNAVLVPLRHRLKSGDVAEILTSDGHKPSKDWLAFVATSKARTKIRQVIRREQRERSRELGREVLEKELRKRGKSLTKLLKAGEVDKAAGELRCHGEQDLFQQVGYGRVTTEKVLELLAPRPATEEEEPQPSGIGKLLKKLTRGDQKGVRIAGFEDVLLRYAKCCHPVPGDPVIGYITRGRGVTIHRRSCRAALDIDPERRIDVEWDASPHARHEVTVRVRCADQPGVLASITQLFSSNGINITEASCRTTEDRRATNEFKVLVKDVSQLNGVIRKIGGISEVYSVERVQG